MIKENVHGRRNFYRGIAEVFVGLAILLILALSTFSDDWLLAYGIVPFLLQALIGLFFVSLYVAIRGLVRVAFWIIRERK